MKIRLIVSPLEGTSNLLQNTLGMNQKLLDKKSIGVSPDLLPSVSKTDASKLCILPLFKNNDQHQSAYKKLYDNANNKIPWLASGGEKYILWQKSDGVPLCDLSKYDKNIKYAVLVKSTHNDSVDGLAAYFKSFDYWSEAVKPGENKEQNDWLEARSLIGSWAKKADKIDLYVQGHGAPGRWGISSDEGQYLNNAQICSMLEKLEVSKYANIKIKINSCWSGAGVDRVYASEKLAANSFKENLHLNNVSQEDSLCAELKRQLMAKGITNELYGYIGPTSIFKEKGYVQQVTDHVVTHNPLFALPMLESAAREIDKLDDLETENHMGVAYYYYDDTGKKQEKYIRRSQARLRF
ncbi:hypothetical protein INR79_15855 [Vibrio sp. SCSIO 43132]|uniref:C13 family peptidase n=1 Tax=Vibrio sp. SCSIO 43132 TaxID=2779363 RepID=UPI001CA940E9|nr:C13 family peptidase [Vibrio sp. SCSIO 43132]UAB69964.1 hypothetical protein INR79_15855 [Vibrio sp. SCSIO 43132]